MRTAQNLVKLLLILTTLFSYSLSAAPYSGNYYKQANLAGLSGYALKTALHKLLSKTHHARGYGELYNAYLVGDLDVDFEGDRSIVDIYSENPKGEDSYNYHSRSDTCGNYRAEGDCFNREHIFPQSAFYKKLPMRSDYFHIFPTDGKVNGVRSNYPHGEVTSTVWTSENGSKLGKSSLTGYNGEVFEPIDEFKGDVARALLYFAIRYEDRIKSFRYVMLDGTSDHVYKKNFLAVLIRWHKLDPVSDHERRRNDNGESFQGNRNPLIDHPEYVSQIWE